MDKAALSINGDGVDCGGSAVLGFHVVTHAKSLIGKAFGGLSRAF
jgi:hypothetical protein